MYVEPTTLLSLAYVTPFVKGAWNRFGNRDRCEEVLWNGMQLPASLSPSPFPASWQCGGLRLISAGRGRKHPLAANRSHREDPPSVFVPSIILQSGYFEPPLEDSPQPAHKPFGLYLPVY